VPDQATITQEYEAPTLDAGVGTTYDILTWVVDAVKGPKM
jgi:hypothetical protein